MLPTLRCRALAPKLPPPSSAAADDDSTSPHRRRTVGIRPPHNPFDSDGEVSLLAFRIRRAGGSLPVSVRLLQRRKKLANAARPSSPELGAAGSAVASLAAAVEAVQGAAAFCPPPAAKARSDAGDAVVWLFRKVFVSSPSLAVAVLGLVSEYLAMSVGREMLRVEMEAKKKNVLLAPTPAPAPAPKLSEDLAVVQENQSAVLRAAYEKMVADGTANSLVLSNYAQLLYEHEKDMASADVYFNKAVQAEPEDGEAMRRYAMFLWQERGELEKAEEMFQEAMAAEPRCGHHQSCYAWFLWMTGGDGTCLVNDTGEDG